jgi:hypothetical protein
MGIITGRPKLLASLGKIGGPIPLDVLGRLQQVRQLVVHPLVQLLQQARKLVAGLDGGRNANPSHEPGSPA